MLLNKLFDLLDNWRNLPSYQLEKRADIFFAVHLEKIIEKIAVPKIDFIFPEHPCDLSATDTCLMSNIETKFNDSDFSIFPNPAKDRLQIKISSELLANEPRLNIISTTGSICRSQILTNEETNIDVNEFKAGIYLTQIVIENKTVLNKKIIIVK